MGYSLYDDDYDVSGGRTPEDYGWVRVDEIPDLDHMKDFLQGLIEAIYVTGDVDHMETCLEEVASQMGLKLPIGAPKLEKINNDM